VFDRIIECHEYRRGTKLKSYNQDLWKKRIFVKNIPLNFSNIRLKEIFEPIGKVLIASITKPKSGVEKAFNTGFITFADENDAKRALLMQKIELFGGITLYIDKCISKKKNQKGI
jgi:RNA recognition motif-containing protein